MVRRQRYTGKQMPPKSEYRPQPVNRILQRLGLNKLSALAGRTGASLRAGISWRTDPHRHQKLGRIGSVGHRITGRYPGAVIAIMASVGSSSTSALMTPHALLSCSSRKMTYDSSAVLKLPRDQPF